MSRNSGGATSRSTRVTTSVGAAIVFLAAREETAAFSAEQAALEQSTTFGTASSVAAFTAAAIAAGVTTAIHNFVTASFESFFGLTTNTFVAVTESTRQSSHDFRSAAATVLANLVANFVGCLFTDTFISVVQRVDEGTHDFRIATAVEIVTQRIDCFTAIFRITGSLRFVDQLGNFARIGIATDSFTTFSAASVSTAIVLFATRQSAEEATFLATEQTAAQQAATFGFASGVAAGFSRSTALSRCTAVGGSTSVSTAIILLAASAEEARLLATEQTAVQQAATFGFASGVAAGFSRSTAFSWCGTVRNTALSRCTSSRREHKCLHSNHLACSIRRRGKTSCH